MARRHRTPPPDDEAKSVQKRRRQDCHGNRHKQPAKGGASGKSRSECLGISLFAYKIAGLRISHPRYTEQIIPKSHVEAFTRASSPWSRLAMARHPPPGPTTSHPGFSPSSASYRGRDEASWQHQIRFLHPRRTGETVSQPFASRRLYGSERGDPGRHGRATPQGPSPAHHPRDTHRARLKSFFEARG